MISYLATGILVLDGPLHVGTGKESHVTDSPVFRDAFGLYRIPGTSLAGVFRHAIRASAGAELADDLFGCMQSKASPGGHGSRLLISDGYLVDLDGKVALEKVLCGQSVLFPSQPIIQDCVRIDEGTGTAATGGKFDLELVPSGTRFAFGIEYEPSGDGDHVAVLKQLLIALRERCIQIGGGTSRGLGYVHADQPSLVSFDLATADGLRAWRDRPYGLLERPRGGRPLEIGTQGLQPAQVQANLSGFVRIVLDADGPLLVGGSQGALKAAQEADLTFAEIPVADYDSDPPCLTSCAIVPGSSLKGVLRHRAGHILRCLGTLGHDRTLGSLFGTVETGTQEDGSRKTVARKSKVAVSGCLLPKAEYVIVQHVAIDRLTGGALDGALFSEAPIWADGVALSVELRLSGLTLAEAGLLAHAIMDLGEGRLPIGGGTRRGNGRLKFAESRGGAFFGKLIEFDITFDGRRYTQDTDQARLTELLKDASDAFVQEFPQREETRDAHAKVQGAGPGR